MPTNVDVPPLQGSRQASACDGAGDAAGRWMIMSVVSGQWSVSVVWNLPPRDFTTDD